MEIDKEDSMERWNNVNMSAILEYPFDFHRYVEERIREIDDLDERRFAKKIMAEGLLKAILCTDEKYQKLEQRVYEEVAIGHSQYEVVMTIVKRSHYDPANGTLNPVIEQDLSEKKLANILSGKEQVWLGTLFLKADDKAQKRFREKESWTGTLEQDGEVQQKEFFIQPAKRYRDMMEELYRIFQDNHIPWETVHTGFLDKFYDVYINAPLEDIGRNDLGDANISFGEYEEAACMDWIPLWNLEWVSFDSADFMLPCINDIYYEHEFSVEDREQLDGYLIQSQEDILEIRHEKEKIVIKSQKETFENWKALCILQKKTIRSLDYTEALLSNHKKDSFIRRNSINSRVQLMTKADLFRRIMELDVEDYIEIAGYEICENGRDFPNIEGMNWFVRDELFPMASRKILLLKFQEKQPGNYLNDSMVRFVISQIQLEISEYRCVGVLE